MFFIMEKSEKTTFDSKFCKHLIKMETQKIVNLLKRSENEYSKFASKNGTLLTVKQMVTIHTKIQSHF